MTPIQRRILCTAIIPAILCAACAPGHAVQPGQGLLPAQTTFRPPNSAAQVQAQTPASALNKPSPGNPVASTETSDQPTPRRSLLDEPAGRAQVRVNDGRLSITATNSSLSEVIRQVATQTGMQVEGNSRDQRVFGVYGPGSPPDVLSALLYDSGYNVIMVGSTADGAPRRLLLSARTTSTATAQAGAAAPVRSNEDDDEEPPPQETAPPPPNPGALTPPGMPPSQNGQPRTPQQMLEELQRMHQGQQPPDFPKQQEPE